MNYLLNIFLFILVASLNAQEIKTAQLFNPQTNDLTPFISKSEYLIFSFDDLEAGYKRYQYKIVRYDRNWERSDIFTSEYLDGYDKNYIREYTNSFNTRVNYTHYQVSIPNNDFSFKLSGNYGVQLLAPNSNQILLEKRFSVYEDITQLGVSVNRMNSADNLNQLVAVQINSPDFDLTQNQNESLLVLLKNNNWNESLKVNQPSFAQPNQFTFNKPDQSFAGGNEYNWFDTKNLEISGLTTQNIIKEDIYSTVLYPISFSPDQAYVDMPDVNGNYFIRSTQIPYPSKANSEADYTEVYFALEGYKPEADEEVFVFGAFNNFQPTEESILHYINDTQLLETNMLLKQGYYNYSFAIRNTKTGKIDYNKITGSYWQTENLYTALFYYRPWGKRYDLLIGYGEGFSRPSPR
ncbi:MAG: type IX secretion system plug protein domain-containing protein [Weeksellaceae bacterium]